MVSEGGIPRRLISPGAIRQFIFLLLVSLLLTILLNACGAPLEAELAATVTSGQAPLSVTLSNNSKSADEFQWDFGDGATTTTRTKDELLTHEYTLAGTYAVTLTAIKKREPPKTRTASVRITVEPGPLDRVTLEPGEPVIEVTKWQSFTATALDQFDNVIPGLTYVYRSEEQAGQVDSDGTL